MGLYVVVVFGSTDDEISNPRRVVTSRIESRSKDQAVGHCVARFLKKSPGYTIAGVHVVDIQEDGFQVLK